MNKKYFYLFLLCGLSIAATPVVANITVVPPTISATYAQMSAGTNYRSHTDGSPILLPTNNRWLASHVFARYQSIAPGQSGWVGGVEHVKSFGSTIAPYQGVEWVKKTCKTRAGDIRSRCIAVDSESEKGEYLFTNFGDGLVQHKNSPGSNEDVTVNLWLMSVFHPASHAVGQTPNSCAAQYGNDELIAFVHEESIGGINGFYEGVQYGNEGRTRLGLARSINGGNNWTYLGRIVKPFDDINFNIKGAPYYTEDGYFYVMYDDVETDTHGPHNTTPAGAHTKGIARAQIEQVLCAARINSVGSGLWFKHYNDAFNEPAMGGPIAGGRHTTPWAHKAARFNSGYIGQQSLKGTIHTQAAYSTYSDRYYMPLTKLTWPTNNPAERNAVVDLRISDKRAGSEGEVVQWEDSIQLAWEPASEHGVNPGGNQYCSVTDANGYSNAVVGAIFFVSCVNLGQDALDGSEFMEYSSIYRWKIDLTGAIVKVDSLSSDFSYPAPAGEWRYKYGDGSGIYDAVSHPGGFYTAPNSPDGSVLKIYPDAVFPTSHYDPILSWTAEEAKLVHVGGIVRSANTGEGKAHCNGSDGVSASIIYNKINGQQSHLFLANINKRDTSGISPNLFLNVSVGDELLFIVNKKANSTCDLTSWDPVIEYLN